MARRRSGRTDADESCMEPVSMGRLRDSIRSLPFHAAATAGWIQAAGDI